MIARKSFVIMVTQALSAVIGLLALTAVSKLWGSSAPSLLGVVWFGMAFVGTFSFITNMGFDATHIKKVSEGKDLGTCNGTFLAIKLILVSILVLSVVSGIAIWKYILNKEFYDATKESVIYIFLGFYVFFALAQIPIMTFNGLRKNVKSQFTLIIEYLIRSPLMVLVALAGVTGAYVTLEGSTEIINIAPTVVWPSFLSNLQDYLATNAIGALSFAYFFGAFAMFIMGFFLLREYPIKRPTREYFSFYLKFAIPLMVPIFFTFIIFYIDKVMLGYFWTSTEVGHYFAVQRLTTMVLMISSAVGIVLYPTVSTLDAKYKHDRKKLNLVIAYITRNSERYSSMVTVPIVFIIIVFAVPIIDIVLNSSFRPAELSLQLLTIYTYVLTLCMPFRYLILGMDQPETIARVVIISGIMNVFFNLLLIPENGLLSQFDINGPSGAALAALISALVMFIGFHRYSRRITKVRFRWTKVIVHLVAGSIMGLTVWEIGTHLEPLKWYFLVGLAFVGTCMYVGILWLFGEFKKKDYRFFMDTVNPMNVFRYIKDEIWERPKKGLD